MRSLRGVMGKRDDSSDQVRRWTRNSAISRAARRAPIACQVGNCFEESSFAISCDRSTQNRRISRLLLRNVLTRRFSERRRRLFNIQNIVRNLKRPPNRFAEVPEPLISSSGAPAQIAPAVIEARINAAVFER